MINIAAHFAFVLIGGIVTFSFMLIGLFVGRWCCWQILGKFQTFFSFVPLLLVPMLLVFILLVLMFLAPMLRHQGFCVQVSNESMLAALCLILSE